MFSTLLDAINRQFTSKSYWLGSMFPLILFLAANVLVAYPHYGWLAGFTSPTENWDQKTIKYSALLATILATAFVLSTVNSVLLRMLEGKIGPFRWVAPWLSPAHKHALKELDRKYVDAVGDRDNVRDAIDYWRGMLSAAKEAGDSSPELSGAHLVQYKSDAGKQIDKIRRLQARGAIIPFESLRTAV